MNIQRVERIALILILCWTIKLFFDNPLTEIVMLRMYGIKYFGKITALLTMNHKIMIFLNYLVQFGVALWLFMQAKHDKVSRWIWGFLGLLLNINAAILYFLVQLLEEKKQETRV